MAQNVKNTVPSFRVHIPGFTLASSSERPHHQENTLFSARNRHPETSGRFLKNWQNLRQSSFPLYTRDISRTVWFGQQLEWWKHSHFSKAWCPKTRDISWRTWLDIWVAGVVAALLIFLVTCYPGTLCKLYVDAHNSRRTFTELLDRSITCKMPNPYHDPHAPTRRAGSRASLQTTHPDNFLEA